MVFFVQKCTFVLLNDNQPVLGAPNISFLCRKYFNQIPDKKGETDLAIMIITNMAYEGIIVVIYSLLILQFNVK